jgi:hypothetical protein
MPALEKAVLEEVSTDELTVVMPIQFNPTSLRMQISNRTEGGEQQGRQARQYVGTGSTTLSLELVYDTADEGTTDQPRSAIEYTSQLEYFITPRSQGNQRQAPPRVRFRWGQLSLEGVVESLNVDFDLFAHDGTPLRAKASLSIKGQNPDYEFGEVGPAANQGGGEPAPGQPKAAAQPGAKNNPLSKALNGLMNNPVTNALGKAQGAVNKFTNDLNSKIARALDGESLAQLAQRAGLDPNGWRALSAGLTNPIGLAAGLEIPIGGKIGLTAGVGAQTGAQAGSGANPQITLGLAPSNTQVADSGGTAALNRGYALSAAGGVGAAIETVKTGTAVAGRLDARLAFAGAAGNAEPRPPMFAQPGARMAVFTQRADPRATSFGASVPLRDLIQIATEERANALNGQTRVKAGPPFVPGFPPVTLDPTRPGWTALPLRAAKSTAAGGGKVGCGCGGGRRGLSRSRG